jgi:hypothetical protein
MPSLLPVLDLSHNQFTGTLPPEWAETFMQRISHITWNFSHNALEGTIPQSFYDIEPLERSSLSWNLSNNRFEGSIPTMTTVQLSQLDISNNQFTGTISGDLCSHTSLTRLKMDNNQLHGAIPTKIGLLASLSTWSVANNNLIGPIPTQLAVLSNLKWDFRNNQISGEVPKEFARTAPATWLADNNPVSLSSPHHPSLCSKFWSCENTSIPSSSCAICTEASTSTRACVDHHDEVKPCLVLALSGGCDVADPDTRVRGKEMCPFSCGCCGSSDDCICDDDDSAHLVARAHGYGWITSCKKALKYVSCSNPVYGSLLRQHCPCSCPSL